MKIRNVSKVSHTVKGKELKPNHSIEVDDEIGKLLLEHIEFEEVKNKKAKEAE